MSAHKPLPSTETGHLPTLLDGTPYRFIAPLGRGAMGDVVEAEHVALGKRVVVKLLQERHAYRPDYVDRMRIEAQALAKISHANLVQVTDFGQTAQGRTFLVMERLRGRNLREELDQRGYLPVIEAMSIVRQALQGLAAAHDAGIVHRDVKLENLFLCETSTNRRVVKVLDFGVAKVIGLTGENTPLPLAFPTAEGVAMGTPRYFSPEQARGREVDWRTDVYAAGIVLYTLVTGRGPFDHHTTLLELTRAHAFEPPEAPSRIAPQPIPPELDAAILKALAKEALDRFPTALAFAVELERVASKLNAAISSKRGASVAPPPDTSEPTTRPRAQHAATGEDDEVEATLRKIPVRKTGDEIIVEPPPVSEDPRTIRLEEKAVAAAVAAALGTEEETGVVTQRIAAPMLQQLRQTTSEAVPSQAAPTTRPTHRAIPPEAIPDKPAGVATRNADDSRPADSASFGDLDGPVPTDPSAGQTRAPAHETYAETPVVGGAVSDTIDHAKPPASIAVVEPGSLAKQDQESPDLEPSGTNLSFAARVAEHASAAKADRASALPGRKDRISALPGRPGGDRVSALPGGRKGGDRISALPARPGSSGRGSIPDTDPVPEAAPTPPQRSMPQMSPAQVHIPGPPPEDANAQGLRPLKAPVPWRVRRTAPGAARAPANSMSSKALGEPKQDNSKMYYIVIAMIAIIAAGTYFLLRLSK